MYCNNCGAQIPDGVRYCNVCGARYISNKTTKKSELKQKKKQLRRRKKVAATILILCLVIIGLALAIVYLLPPLKHLYLYDSSEVNANTFTQSTINYDVSIFKYTCLTYLGNKYYIFSPENGEGWEYGELKRRVLSVGNLSVRELGKSAYMEMQYNTGGSFTIVYHKASLTERLYIIKQFLSWNQ